MQSNSVNLVGNLTRDPELRFTAAGNAVCTFSVAWNYKPKNGGEEVSFFNVVAFGSLAENIKDSVAKGNRVAIQGRLKHSTFEAEDGSTRHNIEIIAEDVAPSLRWASAEVAHNERVGGERQSPSVNAPSGRGENEEPF